jgi:hypothetical protein
MVRADITTLCVHGERDPHVVGLIVNVPILDVRLRTGSTYGEMGKYLD